MSTYAALVTSAEAEKAAREKRVRDEIALSMRQLNNRPAAFQPAALPEVAKQAVARFGQRGVRLAAGENGALIVSPAGQLSPTDRTFLLQHKNEIIAYLSSHEIL